MPIKSYLVRRSDRVVRCRAVHTAPSSRGPSAKIPRGGCQRRASERGIESSHRRIAASPHHLIISCHALLMSMLARPCFHCAAHRRLIGTHFLSNLTFSALLSRLFFFFFSRSRGLICACVTLVIRGLRMCLLFSERAQALAFFVVVVPLDRSPGRMDRPIRRCGCFVSFCFVFFSCLSVDSFAHSLTHALIY